MSSVLTDPPVLSQVQCSSPQPTPSWHQTHFLVKKTKEVAEATPSLPQHCFLCRIVSMRTALKLLIRLDSLFCWLKYNTVLFYWSWHKPYWQNVKPHKTYQTINGDELQRNQRRQMHYTEYQNKWQRNAAKNQRTSSLHCATQHILYLVFTHTDTEDVCRDRN